MITLAAVLILTAQPDLPLTIACRLETSEQVVCTLTNTGTRPVAAWSAEVGGIRTSSDHFRWMAAPPAAQPPADGGTRGLVMPGLTRIMQRQCRRAVEACVAARVVAVVFDDATGIGDKGALKEIYAARSRDAEIIAFWLPFYRQVAEAADPVESAKAALGHAAKAPDRGAVQSREFTGELQRLATGQVRAGSLRGPTGMIARYEHVYAEAIRHVSLTQK